MKKESPKQKPRSGKTPATKPCTCAARGHSCEHRLSASAQRILTVLRHARNPLSAYDILDRVRDQGFRSPPTIYRALDLLESKGFAHRLASLNAFVACRCPKDHAPSSREMPVPFMICSLCGDVRAVDDPALSRTLRKVAARALAGIENGVLEITGCCLACQKTKNEKRLSAHV